MRTTLLIATFLILTTSLWGQLDSTVTYIGDAPLYKKVYQDNLTLFYKMDSVSGQWNMYAKWEDTDSERRFYMQDSLGELVIRWRTVWDDNIEYQYDDSDSLMAYTINYGYVPTLTVITMDQSASDDGVIFSTDGFVLVIQSPDIMEEVRVYDTGGVLLSIDYPMSIRVIVSVEKNKVFIVRVKHQGKYATKKIILL